MLFRSGAVLLGFGIVKVPPQAHYVFWVSLACWIASYGLTGWINSGGEPNRERLGPRNIERSGYRSVVTYSFASFLNLLRFARINYWAFRVFQTISATIMAPVTVLMPAVVITYSALKGRPTRFDVIAKSNSIMDRGMVDSEL